MNPIAERALHLSRRHFFGKSAVGIGAASGGVRALAPAATPSPFDGPLPPCGLDDRLTPHRAPADWA